MKDLNLHLDQIEDVANLVTFVIKVRTISDYANVMMLTSLHRDFGPDKIDKIPHHGRWQHLEAGQVLVLPGCWRYGDMENSKVDDMELTRRLIIDLFFVSVLLDAEAVDNYHFVDPQRNRITTKRRYCDH